MALGGVGDMQALEAADPRRIAGFDILNRIGDGGMGVVYLGRRSTDNTLAAVKVIRDDLLADAEIRARFEREATVAQRVRSPRVAAVLDSGYDHGRAYLAVEFVRGPTLQEAIAEGGALARPQLFDLAQGLAQALVAIHGEGLVHRDLTPRNVLLTHTGPKIIDFGLARLNEMTSFTATGSVIGTPGYIAPERLIRGQSLPAGDVFCAGALLLYAARGRPPFGEGNQMEANYRAANALPDLTGAPPELLGLLRACLAPDPAARPDAAHLSAIATALSPYGSMTPSVPPTSVSLPATTGTMDLGSVHISPGRAIHEPNAGSSGSTSRSPSRRRAMFAWLSAAAVTVSAIVAFAVLHTTPPTTAFSPGTSDTSTSLPSSDPTSANTSPAPATTQAALDTTPAVPKPAPVFSVGALGTSNYSQGGYSAVLNSASADGFTLSIVYDARGASDLRDPSTSCVQVTGSHGSFTFGALGNSLTTNTPGHYAGTLTFPITVPGSYTFTFSCQADYSSVPVGTVTLPIVGISGYQGNSSTSTAFYEATVIEAVHGNGETVLYFAATGPSDLRDPATSCLLDGNQSPVATVNDKSLTGTLNEMIVGTMVFPTADPAPFQYSCTSDYTTVTIP